MHWVFGGLSASAATQTRWDCYPNDLHAIPTLSPSMGVCHTRARTQRPNDNSCRSLGETQGTRNLVRQGTPPNRARDKTHTTRRTNRRATKHRGQNQRTRRAHPKLRRDEGLERWRTEYDTRSEACMQATDASRARKPPLDRQASATKQRPTSFHDVSGQPLLPSRYWSTRLENWQPRPLREGLPGKPTRTPRQALGHTTRQHRVERAYAHVDTITKVPRPPKSPPRATAKGKGLTPKRQQR